MIGLLRILLCTGIVTCGVPGAGAQQLPDDDFKPIIEPEFPDGNGPQIYIDAAHLNLHTADGGYGPFAELLRADGYEVESNDRAFTAEVLATMDILVIVNAMHRQSSEGWAPLPTLSAFTDAEIAATEQWVSQGGSLLLIADHMPLAGHAERLAAAFGLRFMNGFALQAGSGAGRATFRASDGSLAAATVANGRNPDERVEFVTSFTGQAFRVDPDVDAEPVLVFPEGYELLLPEVAWEFSDSTPRVSAAHLLQGVTLRHGSGRVAAFGEAAMFTAQLAGPRHVPVGMNAPVASQNYRLVLNVMHWLSGRLP